MKQLKKRPRKKEPEEEKFPCVVQPKLCREFIVGIIEEAQHTGDVMINMAAVLRACYESLVASGIGLNPHNFKIEAFTQDILGMASTDTIGKFAMHTAAFAVMETKHEDESIN